MSPQRVRDITWDSQTVTSHLQGAPGEEFSFWYILGSKENAVNCKLGDSGLGVFTMNNELGIAECKPM